MKSTNTKVQEPAHLAAAVAELRIPAIPWWGILVIDLLIAIVFATIVSLGVITVQAVTWHMAAILGIAAGELLSALSHLFFSSDWRRRIRSGSLVAYEAFNSFISASQTPLDQKNIPAAANLIGEAVTNRGMNAHMWHAAVGALLCVPAWLSVLAAATAQGASQEQMRIFLTPMFVVVGSSLLTLVVSLLGLFLQRSGLSEWVSEVSSRRINSIALAIDENALAPGSANSRNTRSGSTGQPQASQGLGGRSSQPPTDSEVEELGADTEHLDNEDGELGVNQEDEFNDPRATEQSGSKIDDNFENDDFDEPPDNSQNYTGKRRRDNSRFGE